jgi:hypothetical protein
VGGRFQRVITQSSVTKADDGIGVPDDPSPYSACGACVLPYFNQPTSVWRVVAAPLLITYWIPVEPVIGWRFAAPRHVCVNRVYPSVIQVAPWTQWCSLNGHPIT